MKKPRLPTVEERAEWAENNRGTTKRVVSHESSVVCEDERVVPPPLRRRLGGGAVENEAPTNSRPITQPSPARGEGLKTPLKSLTPRDAKRVFKSACAIEVTLDLHGLSKLDAYARVQQFVMRAHCSGRRHVAIITGKGRLGEAGVLRSNLPHWLNEPALRPFIAAFAHARAEKGGEGVTHVLLKRAS